MFQYSYRVRARCTPERHDRYRRFLGFHSLVNTGFHDGPRLRPPASSLREEGDPTTVDVTLRGFGSLVMQARQNIGRSFDVYCCHPINVVLYAARTHADAVLMELLIVDSSRTEHNLQSLGVQSVANPIQTLTDAAGEIGTTTYSFEMPRHSVLRSSIHSLSGFICSRLELVKVQCCRSSALSWSLKIASLPSSILAAQNSCTGVQLKTGKVKMRIVSAFARSGFSIPC